MSHRKSDSGAPEALAFEFFNEVGIISQLSSTRMQRALPHGMTQSQFSVLNWFVRVDTQASPTRLANAFQVTKGAMTNTLGKLEEKGFISIEPDPTSGRSKIVTMTSAGARARKAALGALTADLEQFLGAFSVSDLRTALPFLKEVRAFLDAARE
ncbi:MAG: MarR family transcriptional regulator [Pseudomonadota bacterium]